MIKNYIFLFLMCGALSAACQSKSDQAKSYEKVFEKVKPMIIDMLQVLPEEVKPEANLTEDLSADELDFVELIMKMEAEFNISIPDERAEKVKTVDDLVKEILFQKKSE